MNTRQYHFTKWWLTGFTQADGGFIVNFESRGQGNLPVYPRPSFVLTQSIREEQMMIELHKYLGAGRLSYCRNEISIVVRSQYDLTTVILPHFDTYPLRGYKLSSYLIFKEAVLMMTDKKHLSPEGFLQILELCYFANHTTLRTLETKQAIVEKIQTKYGNVEFEPILLSNLRKPSTFAINTDYLVGLVDGDGCFSFGFITTRRRISTCFTVVQGSEDRSVLEDVQSYLGCGKVYDQQSKSSRYQVGKVTDLLEKVLPEFKDNLFNTAKKDYFDKVEKAWLVLASGIRDEQDQQKVVELVYNINQNGKWRKQSKEDYTKQFSKSPSLYNIYIF